MSLKMTCPNPACAKRYAVAVDVVGRSIRCKGCGQTFVAGDSVTVNDRSASAGIEPSRGDSPTVPATLPGDARIGRFVLRGKVGAGAFGTVYRAYDPQLDREVALKVPSSGAMTNAKQTERFLREAKAAANLRHPHIVPVFDAGKDGDTYYIASAFIDGKPLSDDIPEGGTDFTRAARLARELADGLAYAHEQGTVHRDVKPHNIMLDRNDRVHLMDFGLATRQDEDAKLTRDGTVMGTPAYMAPEQAAGQKGEAKPAADQYAVGVVLYELLTGQVPFKGPLAVVIHNVLRTEPEPPRKRRADVPRDLETICLKALSKRPEDRYPACHVLAADLRRWLEGEPITARRQGLTERAVRWVRREPKLAGAAVVVSIVLVASTALVSNAARSAAGALERAEREAAEAREAGQRAADALADARAAREREDQATREALGHLGTVTDVRNKLLALQEQVTQEQQAAAQAQAQVATERTRAAAAEAREDAAVRAQRAAELRAQRAPLPQRASAQLAHRESLDGDHDKAKEILEAVPAEQRGWEWSYAHRCAERATTAPLKLAPKPSGTLRAAAANPNGTLVAAACGDENKVRVWDTRTGAETHLLDGHFGAVLAMAFSPDGKQLATGGQDRAVIFWDAQTGKEVGRLKNTSPAPALAFSPDGASLTRGGQVWAVATRKHSLDLKFESLGDKVDVTAFSPSGSRVLTVGAPLLTGTPANDRNVCVWDAKTGKHVFDISGHTDTVNAAVYSPKGDRLVTCSDDGTALVRGTANGCPPLFPLKGHTGRVLAAAFSPDGERIATGGQDETVRVWDAKTGQLVLTLAHGSRVRGVCWAADGTKLIAQLNQAIEVHDSGSAKP